MIIYAKNFVNAGKITANGANGGSAYRAAGAGSGGGSINVFYGNTVSGSIGGEVTGGIGGTGTRGTYPYACANGGNGGNGTVTFKKIDMSD